MWPMLRDVVWKARHRVVWIFGVVLLLLIITALRHDPSGVVFDLHERGDGVGKSEELQPVDASESGGDLDSPLDKEDDSMEQTEPEANLQQVDNTPLDPEEAFEEAHVRNNSRWNAWLEEAQDDDEMMEEDDMPDGGMALNRSWLSWLKDIDDDLSGKDSLNISSEDAVSRPVSSYELVWITVCTPPGCHKNAAPLVHLRRTVTFPVRILDSIGGEAIKMNTPLSRSAKLRILNDYLINDPEGLKWKHIVLADATDVVANPGSAADVLKVYKNLTGSHDKLLLSAEGSCWISAICKREFVQFLTAKFAQHFAPRPGMDAEEDVNKFLCAGQYIGTRRSVLHLLEFAIATLEALHEGREVELPVDKELYPNPSGDQGMVTLYWINNPSHVVMDHDSLVFGTVKRWFKLKNDDGARRRRFDNGCRLTEKSRRKSFVLGTGWFCHGGYGSDNFKWHCDENSRMWLTLYHDHHNLRPLLGWHGNGNVGHSIFEGIMRGYPRWRC